ncbi:14404_t:CDS:2, partial [Gigaspora rosea]
PPKRQSSDKHFEESKSDKDVLDKSDYETNEDKINKSTFYEAHNAILNNAKMQLTLGRIVEDILFNYVKDKEYEDGVIEATRSYLSELDRKYLNENFKMPKTLYNMLTDHIWEVDYNEVFGILHFGLRIQFTRLWCARGSIPIFHKDPQLFYLDNKFLAEGIIAFLKFLAAVYWYVLNSKGNNNIEPDENDLYNKLLSIPPPSSHIFC